MDDSQVTSQVLDTGTATNDSPVAPIQTTTAEPVASKTETSEPKSVRDAVLKAFEKSSKTASSTDAVATPSASPTAAPTAGATTDPATKPVDPVTGRVLEPIKAPGSWTPALREKWGSVDRQMQQFIVDRDKDIAKTLQETADARRLSSEFREAVAPYEAMLRSRGTTATSYAKELFNIDYQLRAGSPQQKAQLIHRMITDFQPDVNTLIQLSQGYRPQVSSPAPQPVNVQHEVEKALAARESQTLETQVLSEWQKFSSDPKNEFVEDLAPIMKKALDADFIEDNGNVQEMFDKAYQFAAQQHPEVRQILAQRGQGTAPVTTQAPVQQTAGQPTVKAVGSVKPSLPTGGRSAAPAQKPMSTREAAMAAWDKLQR